jgi:hypothetical protein
MMLRRSPLRASLLAGLMAGTLALASVAACAPFPIAPAGAPESPGARITVRPMIHAYGVKSTDVAAFTAADVTKLTVALFAVASDATVTPTTPITETPVMARANGATVPTPVSVDLAPGQFDAPLTFNNLPFDTYYRIRVTAYRTVNGQDQVISTSDAGSYTDVRVTRDTATLQNTYPLKVQLAHRALSARMMSGPVALNPASPVGDREAPAIAYNPDMQQYLLVWVDRRFASREVYAQRLAANGTALGGEILLSKASGQAAIGDQDQPSVSYNRATGNYMVTWRDFRDLMAPGVYGQIVTGAGTPAELSGTNFVVAGSSLVARNHPTVTANTASPLGTASPYMVAWSDANGALLGRLFGASGVAGGAEFALSVTTTGLKATPALGFDPTANQYMAAFSAAAGSGVTAGVFAQRLGHDGQRAGEAVRLSTGDHAMPALAFNPAQSSCLVAWEDQASNTIQAQLVVGGAPVLGAPITLSEAGNAAALPAVAFNSTSGEYLVAWSDGRNSDKALYARRLTADGTPVGAPFAMIAGTYVTSRPAIAYNPTHNEAYLAWPQAPSLNLLGLAPNDIFGQRLDYFAQ